MERLRIVQKYFNSIIIIRLMLSLVFISEGIQKFIFSDTLGVGRFIKIGIPHPGIMAPFVGIVEIVCGGLILLGLFTRLATLPLLISMFVAFSTTKIPLLLEKGFWAMAHEARTDWCMILGLIFLFIVGSGRWSLDYFRTQPMKSRESS
ncbi:MAG: DoxX family protein [Ignavibacteriae bacterium]|nr:MAG: DoxX family protein [Ignavibacteriota bacterium]